MLNFLLEFSIRQRALVLLATLGLLAAGIMALLQLPIDAVPDLTGPQVQVNVNVPALAPEESERAVTRPIEMALSGHARRARLTLHHQIRPQPGHCRV
jgi:cobalt-zinc-cadmium resistance protein CzcA